MQSEIYMTGTLRDLLRHGPPPAGVYDWFVHAVRPHTSRAGNAVMQVTFETSDGDHAGGRVVVYLDGRRLHALLEGVRLGAGAVIEDLVGLRVRADLAFEEDDDGNEWPRLEDFRPTRSK